MLAVFTPFKLLSERTMLTVLSARHFLFEMHMHTYTEETVSNGLYTHSHTHILLFRELWIRGYRFVNDFSSLSSLSLLFHLMPVILPFFLLVLFISSLLLHLFLPLSSCFFHALLSSGCSSVVSDHSQYDCLSTVRACVSVSVQACICFTKKSHFAASPTIRA